jgi:LysM repeat protein
MRTSELKSLNKLSGDTIRVGQKLTVQGGAKATVSQQVYVVKSGDSLYLIARKHGVSVDDLQRWNSLRGDTIQPGQKLVVRAARRVSAR